MGEFDIGNAVPRTEDPRLLSGGGRYVDDIDLPGLCRAHILRSPHAHAAIRGIDADAARAMPGVHAVLTGADYAASGLGTIQAQLVLKTRDGAPMVRPPFAPLAIGRAVHVGEAVAVVIADTLARARDAAEAVDVDFEPLDANVDTAAADAEATPALWPEAPRNESFVHFLGDRGAMEAGFARAAHVVERRFAISRVTSNTMEPRAFLGDVDRAGRHTLHAAVHYPHRIRSALARDIFRLPENRVRVIANDVGGSFGLRGGMYPEQILVLWASRETGRPVKWTCERSEGLISDHQGRDNVTDAALALDDAGNFLAMRVRTRVNIGAYVASMAGGPATANLGTLAGTYVTPSIHVETAGVFTNTNPTCPYRGAGRPEAAYVIEQLIDAAARRLGRDPVGLRRQNTIPEDAMPFRTGLVFEYDCGAFEKNLDRALELAGHAGFEPRRRAARSRGRLRGIGISNTIERAGAPSQERALLRFDPSGTATLFVGTISHGQGHETVYKQIVCQTLGIDPATLRVAEGDSDALSIGGGTGGSRSATLGGSAVLRAAGKIVDQARPIAAHLLEAAPDDLEFADGSFRIAGTDRSVKLVEAARAAYLPARLPAEMEPGLEAGAGYVARVENFPNGCHVCEVEIDPDTGETRIVDYCVVDDVGTVLNPLLLKGQIHGGVAQGLGQAVMERIVFDGSGQNLSGSFMDYAMPRADDMCGFKVEANPVPTATNPLGVKGAGEAGTVGALPAVTSAILDALAPLGVEAIDMPASPETVWRAIERARR
ncbi:MAG: xanthine dehydrogenase family protein molybdopterin-binding subunit [Defluviicoccus sp.]|nr:xanthine dehydrogenase family protein molybdopterin-binding subunit [Defluviicoccus sp.]MDE0384189.1 xanthine dehydrogenase family protein molybdopterin-binding subunit [Defluviicoccus sp.]